MRYNVVGFLNIGKCIYVLKCFFGTVFTLSDIRENRTLTSIVVLFEMLLILKYVLKCFFGTIDSGLLLKKFREIFGVCGVLIVFKNGAYSERHYECAYRR